MRTPDAIDVLRSRSHVGQKLHEIAGHVLALETIKTVDIPSPVYLSEAEGPFVWDADGYRYLDLTMGFGAHILGHRPKPVQKALAAQVDKGWHFGLTNTMQAEFAEELLKVATHMDKVLFAGSGTEATMYAIRAARAFTGRDKVVVFDGSYHGSHDYALVKADPMSRRDEPTSMMHGSGVPELIRDQLVMTAPYLNDHAFDRIRKHGEQIAAVLVQPVQNNLPTLSGRWFLEGLRAVCDEIGAMLIFDEVVTAFRIAPGGGQEKFQVRADIAAYGKSIGGGLPIGALAGRGDVMELFARDTDAGGVFSSGTFSANPLSVVAGLAAMRYMQENRDTLYPYLNEHGDRLSASVNRLCTEHEFPMQLMNAGSMICIHFQHGRIESSRDFKPADKAAVDAFFYQLMARGVLIPGNRLVFISSAHQPEHIDTIIEAITSSLSALRVEGLM